MSDRIRPGAVHADADAADNASADTATAHMSRYAIVARSVVEEKKSVTCLFREEPAGETDSGWVITAGESREQIDDDANILLLRLRDVIRLSPGIEPLLHSPPGSAFRRAADGEPFEAKTFRPRDG